jgi:hypothetical protein
MPHELVLNGDPNLRITARDHTLIMQQLMEHPEEIAKIARWDSTRPGNGSLSPLEALRQLPGLPHGMAEKLDELIANQPAMAEAESRMPAAERGKVEKLMSEVRAQKDVPGMLAFLRRVLESNRVVDDPGLAAGVQVAIEMLEDGMSTIYSPNHPFYRKVARPAAKPTPRDDPGGSGSTSQPTSSEPAPIHICSEDVDGALKGGALGGMVGAVIAATTTAGVATPVTGTTGAIFGGALLGGVKSGYAIGNAIINWIRGK